MFNINKNKKFVKSLLKKTFDEKMALRNQLLKDYMDLKKEIGTTPVSVWLTDEDKDILEYLDNKTNDPLTRLIFLQKIENDHFRKILNK